MTGVFAYFINRPIPANMLLVLILGLAVIAVSKLQRLAYPRADFERVNIYTVYPGAVPKVMERSVTAPLEKALLGIPDIKRITSRSTDHVSLISIVLDSEGRMARTKAAIRKAVAGVRGLPPGIVRGPDVVDIEIDNFHVFEAALIVPDNDPALLLKHAEALRARLLNVSGVAQVHDFGLPKPETRVILERARLARRGVSVSTTALALKKYSGIYGIGGLQRENRRMGLVLDAGEHDLERLRNLRVPSPATFLRGGTPPRIRELGRVENGYHRSGVDFRFNGESGASLLILKQGRADLIRVVERVREVVEEYKKTAPDLRVQYVVDESIPVRNRLSITLGNAALGFVLVLIVLFLFLDPRVAFWTAAGIPIALACALVLLPLFHVTLDTVSLIGMITVLGMVVDDAIIVSESIYRARERGLAPKAAALEGLQAVVRPICITILTTIIAFAPIFLIPGVIGDFAWAIPIVVIIMLIASFLEATFILPGHLAHAGGGHRPYTPPGSRLIAFLREKYVGVLKRLLPRRGQALGSAVLLLILMGGLGLGFTNFNLMPADQAVNMWILGETPAGSSAAFTAAETRKIENLIKRLPPGTVRFTRTVSGFDLDGFLEAPNHFSMRLRLTPPDDRRWSAPRIKSFLLKEMAGAEFADFRNVECFILGAGPPLGRPVELTVSGGDDAGRLNIARKLIKQLERLPVRSPVMDRRAGRKTLVLEVDQDRAARSLVLPEDLALTLRAATRGVRLVARDGKRELRLLVSPGARGDDPLHRLTVANALGRVYPAKALVRTREERALKSIYHFDGRPSITIRAGIDTERTGALQVYRRMTTLFANFSRENPGYFLNIGGEGRENARLFADIVPLFLFTLLVIYGFLAVQFNSLLQPFLVIAPVPFGLAGIALVLSLHGMDLSLMALCGALGFLGVVVNDSVILVHRINRCATEGEAEPVLAAAEQRFRAILLTTLTTVAGLLPTAYGVFGGLDGFISPLVLSMAWGLLFGTVFVLFFVPLLASFLRKG